MVPEVAKQTLEDLIAGKMNMSHIYQPAMLKLLFKFFDANLFSLGFLD